ncbi:MAG: hypothetical protein ACYSUT_10935 [Planctomycetota bacterium]|jgi:hypothetical protein
MSIDAISVTTVSVTAQTVQTQNVEITEPEETTDVVTEPQLEESIPAETEDNSEEKTRGVLRLLQKGHFKGVADVRLRMNFFEEIQEMEAEQLQETADEGLEAINESAQAASQPLTESALLDEDQAAALDEFLDNLENIQSGSEEDDTFSAETLIENLQGSLDSLMGVLTPAPAASEQPEPAETDDGLQLQMPEALMVEPAAEEIITEEPVVEEPAEAPNPLLGLVQDFQEAVQSLIDKLESDLSTSSALPEISEAQGNGKAYAKFLAVYEDMLASASTEADQAESLDLEEPAESIDSTGL